MEKKTTKKTQQAPTMTLLQAIETLAEQSRNSQLSNTVTRKRIGF